jgi:hypothetical protein
LVIAGHMTYPLTSKTEAIWCSKRFVTFYRTVRSHIPEESTLQESKYLHKIWWRSIISSLIKIGHIVWTPLLANRHVETKRILRFFSATFKSTVLRAETYLSMSVMNRSLYIRHRKAEGLV